MVRSLPVMLSPALQEVLETTLFVLHLCALQGLVCVCVCVVTEIAGKGESGKILVYRRQRQLKSGLWLIGLHKVQGRWL